MYNQSPTNREIVAFNLNAVIYNHMFSTEENFVTGVKEDLQKILTVLCPNYGLDVQVTVSSFDVKVKVTLIDSNFPTDPIYVTASVEWGTSVVAELELE